MKKQNCAGVKLTPSYYGKKCFYKGYHEGQERYCDKCAFLMTCFPDLNDPYHKHTYGDRRDFWKPKLRTESCLNCLHHDEKSIHRYRIKVTLFCKKTKRWGRELRANRCPHFENANQSIAVFAESEGRKFMTVRELLDVISASKEVFIKPPGRRLYFDGIAEDVPESLLDAVVTEIVPQVYRDSDYDAVRKYYGGFGVWVNPIPMWDEWVDTEARIAKKVCEKESEEELERQIPSFDALIDL